MVKWGWRLIFIARITTGIITTMIATTMTTAGIGAIVIGMVTGNGNAIRV